MNKTTSPVSSVVVSSVVASAAAPKTRAASPMKDKVVDFPLSPVMTMPDLIKAGFQRDEITACFMALESDGLGIYCPGSKGKGKFAYFEFWAALPNPPVKRMTFKVQKLHSEYAGKPVDAAAAPVEAAPATPATTLNPAFRGLVKTSPTAGKYSVAVVGNVLTAVISDAGADSLESALEEIWASIEGRVSEPNYRNMTRIEAVASKLRGLGFYKLDEPKVDCALLEDTAHIDAAW